MHTSDIPQPKKIIDLVDVPEEVNSIKLNRLQKEKFAQGEQVFLENMQLPDGRIIDGKVKLFKDDKNELQVQIFEKKEILEVPDQVLSYKLTPKDKEDLLAEKVVGIKIPSGQLLYLQVDKDLNRVMVNTERDLSLISEVGNYKLNEKDKVNWINGEKLPTKVFYDDKTNSYFAASIRKTEDGKGIEYHGYKSLKDVGQDKITEMIKRYNEGPDIISTTANVTNSIKVDNSEKSNEKLTDKNFGTLLDHGVAPFENNKENALSYFAKIETDKGEKIVWGVDLKRAIEEPGVKIGDKIKLEFLGQQPVKIEIPVKDDKGNVISKQEIETHRNSWNVETVKHKESTREVNTSHDNDRRFVEYTNNKDYEGLKRLSQEGYKPGKDLIDQTTKQLNLSDSDKSSVMIAIGNETQKKIPVIKEKDNVILTLNNKPYKILEFSENGTKALLVDSQNKKMGVSVEHIRLMSKKEKGLFVGTAKKINHENSLQM